MAATTPDKPKKPFIEIAQMPDKKWTWAAWDDKGQLAATCQQMFDTPTRAAAHARQTAGMMLIAEAIRPA